ncbi:MAG: hypothetical protein PHS96_00595 [Anaerolineales bacterium]|nr:hypothetical protein [Anaerolineales bacterium]
MRTKAHPLMRLACSAALTCLALVGCTPATPTTQGAEETSLLATALPYPPEQAGVEAGEGGVLVGPMPFPTPGTEAIPWEMLINQALIKDVTWKEYAGEAPGGAADATVAFSLQYPQGWHVLEESAGFNLILQNQQPGTSSLEHDFVKFELIPLSEHPSLEEGQILDPDELRTVLMQERPAVLEIRNELPGMARRLALIVEQEATWYALVGTIALPQENPQNLERYTSILLSMMASLRFP